MKFTEAKLEQSFTELLVLQSFPFSGNCVVHTEVFSELMSSFPI